MPPQPPAAPGAKAAPQAFEQSYEGGPLKAPSRTIYIPPPESKGRPKGLRGGRGGKPTGRPGARQTGPLHGRDRVQVEQVESVAGEPARDVRLSAGDPAGEADPEHAREPR